MNFAVKLVVDGNPHFIFAKYANSGAMMQSRRYFIALNVGFVA